MPRWPAHWPMALSSVSGDREGLAAGEPNLLCADALRLDFVQKGGDFFCENIGEPIVPWTRFYIAVLTLEIAQCSSIRPKGV